MKALLDTGAQRSVITTAIAPATKETIPIIGASGKSLTAPLLRERQVQIGGTMVSHQFIHIPECPVPLIGRDLLCKLQATLKFKPTGEVEAHFEDQPVTLLCPVREEWRLYAPLIAGPNDSRYYQDTPFAQQRRDLMEEVPNVWAEVNPGGLAVNAIPLWIELKPNAQVVNQGQYHIPYAARHSMQTHLQKLLQHGVLRPVRSAWNTPLLPVKKPGTSEYRPVQDLRKVNNQVP
ncbi:uncharacterized protein LOC115462050 [Microcaecilia unicolor]|uniref:Uncharacterized protein LOC115462050 n=1 Tax=Microcaecilia unicolor TaxID=1415580 RepID=A0A6P7X665_9AMPH|nr:uncharacterized protein LOC115462050 [Microcaecilia unicolor]